MHTLLAKDVDLAGAILGLVGADSEEGLHGVVGKAAVWERVLSASTPPSITRGTDEPDLRVDAEPRLLLGGKEGRVDVGRQVVLHARLLSSEETGHVGKRNDGLCW